MILNFNDLFDKPYQEYLKGVELENENKMEEAFEAYQSAAELGCADAMWAIANLYLFKGFRKVKVNNIAELVLQGIPVFPWTIVEREEIDYKSVLEWSRKAATKGHALAALVAGVALCEGRGGDQDTETGISYIEFARSQEVQGAEEAYCVFKPKENVIISDSEYEQKLSAFVEVTDAVDLSMSARLFSELKNGSLKQLARLGYVVMAGKNLNKRGYIGLPLFQTENGLPIFPAASKRVGWRTFIRIDRNAFPKNAKILFSSDIGVCPDCLKGLSIVGRAEYISPSFGWLGESKQAYVLEFDDGKESCEDLLEEVKKDFFLTEPEYQPEHIAFFVENGEKEYSVEICALVGERIDILYRYTVGGPDDVKNYIEPKLSGIFYEEV